jgi:hypothetical protein
MTLKEGASNEIVSRWPEHRQRNVALISDWYGKEYRKNMLAGIELVKDHYNTLKAQGATTWAIAASTSNLLDELTR